MDRITLTAGGAPRQYLLFVPPAAPDPCPLVAVLHGRGGTAAWADGETGWSRLAAAERFALAFPDALPPDPARPPSFLRNPPRWDDGSEMRNAECGMRNAGQNPSAIPHSALCIPHSEDVPFLDAVLDDAAARFPLDPRRVYVTGFSNGAGMAFRYAAERAGRLAAVAPVAGHCWFPHPNPSRPVPTLYVVGTADPLIPVRGGDVRGPWTGRLERRPPVTATLERWAVAIGCDPDPRVESDAGGVRTDVYPGPVEFRAVYVDGLGHHWPGGKGRLNRRIAGPPSDHFDATAAIWDFFRRR